MVSGVAVAPGFCLDSVVVGTIGERCISGSIRQRDKKQADQVVRHITLRGVQGTHTLIHIDLVSFTFLI